MNHLPLAAGPRVSLSDSHEAESRSAKDASKDVHLEAHVAAIELKLSKSDSNFKHTDSTG